MAKHLTETIQKSPTSARDLAGLFLGRQIGRGMSRVVYACRYNKDWVIKYEGKSHWQNIREWEIWQEIKDCPELAKWFAPCIGISGNGLFLIRQRVESCSKDQYPEKLPAFFTDTKRRNFGMLNGQFVCLDYGTLLFAKGMNPNRLKKVTWWEESWV